MKKRLSYKKPPDYFRMRHEADEMALRQLKAMGIFDPRLKAQHTYDELREYDQLMASMANTCLKELSESKPVEPQPASHKQTWAERAYA